VAGAAWIESPLNGVSADSPLGLHSDDFLNAGQINDGGPVTLQERPAERPKRAD
jgi:hypothetical protein